MPQRNAEAASVPHLSVAGRPYTLKCREERAPGHLRATHGHNRATKERFYIGNDRGGALWVKGRGKQRDTEEPKGRKCPTSISYGPPVHSKGVGGTQHSSANPKAPIRFWARSHTGFMDYDKACFMHPTPGVVHNFPKAVDV